MCYYSDFVENRGRKEGKAEDLVNLMKKLKLSVEQAMDTLSIPESEWDERTYCSTRTARFIRGGVALGLID